MPGLNSEAATEVALVTRSRVALGNFVSDIAKGEDVKLTNDIYVTEPINVDKATIDLNGHTVTASDTTPFHFTSGESTIKGGTVIGASGVTATAITVSEGATLTIEGGTYSIGKDENGEGNTCIYSDGGTINITDGTFSSEGKFKERYWVLNIKNGSEGSINVTGGKFKNFDPSNPQTDDKSTYVGAGYTVVKEGDYYEVVKEEEVIENFKTALADGGKVTLPGNITVTENMAISKGTNIDLGGNTISSTGTTVFTFNGGTSTIENGNITSGDKCMLVNTGADVTIKSGNYKGTDLQGAECVLSNGGNVTIEGGTFETTGTYNEKHWVLNKINGTQGKIEVKGGKFKNFNPANPQTDDDESYLASGYESKSDGDWYVVEKTAAISRKSKKV